MVVADQNPEQFTVEYFVTEPGEGAQHQALSPLLTIALGTSTQTPSTTLNAPLELVEFATPRTMDLTLDVDHDDGLTAR